MKPKICITFIEGTNCEDETARAFKMAGAEAEKVHLKQLTGNCSEKRKRKLSEYDALIFPGGFSAGDYVRAGAIWTARIQSKLRKELENFLDEDKVVGGICNGFQVLTSLGLLPGKVEAALTMNESAKFESRFVYLKNLRKCSFTYNLDIGEVRCFPIGHAEGRLTFKPGKKKKALKTLKDNSQIMFKYVKEDGSPAKGRYPKNPNGSADDIAGICNQEGNVFGLMPHPERILNKFNHYAWTREKNLKREGEGLAVFESLVDYIKKEV